MKLILNISGEGRKEFELDEELALKIKRDYDDKNVPLDTSFDIDPFNSWRKRQIHGIKLSKESETDNSWEKGIKEWDIYKNSTRKLSPAEKAKEGFGKFKLFCKFFKGCEATDKDLEVFRVRAEKFFESNERYFSVPPKILLDCFGLKYGSKLEKDGTKTKLFMVAKRNAGESGEWPSIKELSQSSILRVIFNAEVV